MLLPRSYLVGSVLALTVALLAALAIETRLGAGRAPAPSRFVELSRDQIPPGWLITVLDTVTGRCALLVLTAGALLPPVETACPEH